MVARGSQGFQSQQPLNTKTIIYKIVTQINHCMNYKESTVLVGKLLYAINYQNTIKVRKNPTQINKIAMRTCT